MFLVV